MSSPDFLARLYDDHAQALFSFLLNLTRNEMDARDLLQDLFVKLAKQPGLLDGVREERAYLIRLVHNLAIDSVRRRHTREKNYERLAGETDSLFAPATDPDERAFRAALMEALGELPAEQRAQLKRRQGVPYPLEEAVTVLDPETMREVPRDGETIGEVMFRGNIVMKGYLKNEKATKEAFAGGWFHTGDLGVLDEHGYVIIKDRSKDIIISGGENISSVEVEDILYKHPAVLFAAVVAKPDSKWGEVPCAFVELKDGAKATEADIIAFCRSHMSGFKTPKAVVFGPIPKTSTGKIQKFLLRNQVDSAKAISA